MDDSSRLLAGLIGLFMVLSLYFVPTIVAYSRNKVNRLSILMLNLFTGWTFIGWVIALVWALTVDRPHQEVG